MKDISRIFTNVTTNQIVMKSSDTIKSILFQGGVGILLVGVLAFSMLMFSYITIDNIGFFKGLSEFFINDTLSNSTFLIRIFLIYLPLLLMIISFFLKPIYTTFDKKTQTAILTSSKRNFTIPFSKVYFKIEGVQGRAGISSYSVAAIAATDIGIQNNANNPVKRFGKTDLDGFHYETLLCSYRMSTKLEAEESVEYIQDFMAGRIKEKMELSMEEEAKFDNLV